MVKGKDKGEGEEKFLRVWYKKLYFIKRVKKNG